MKIETGTIIFKEFNCACPYYYERMGADPISAKYAPDIVHDITQELSDYETYDLVIATHLLEHVPRVSFNKVITNLEELVKKDGQLLVSVPHKYPYHARPIDTLYRPTWQELAPVFRGSVLYGDTFEVDHTLPQYMNDPKCQVSSILLQY